MSRRFSFVTKSLKFVLLLAIFSNVGFALKAFDFFEMKYDQFLTHFDHLLTPGEIESVTHKDDFGVKSIRFPVDATFEKSFKFYLQNHGLKFTREQYKGTEVYDKDLLKKMWVRLPENMGLKDSILKFIEWENFVNEFVRPENRHAPVFFKLWHYDVPADLLGMDIAKYANKDIVKALMFVDKKGVKYVRYPINPEDGTYYKIVEEQLKNRGLSIERKSYFYGFLTASRSLMIVDPASKKVWGLKTGTDHTGGIWTHKPMKYEQMDEARYLSDYIQHTEEKVSFQYANILKETIGVSLTGQDMGFSVREYPELNDGDKYYLPAFSAQHSLFGDKFAKEHESTNANAYWRDHLNKPLARATAEFIAYTGLSYSSAHSQQFLIELDSAMNPTGRIVFRDIGDTYLMKSFFNAIPESSKSFVNRFKFSYKKGNLWVRFALFKTVKYSNWMFSSGELMMLKAAGYPKKNEEMNAFEAQNPDFFRNKLSIWGQEFFNEFERVFSGITGMNTKDLKHGQALTGSYKTYITKKYGVAKSSFLGISFGVKDGWKSYFNTVGCFQGAKLSLDGKVNCQDFLSETSDKMIYFHENNR